MLRNKLKCSKEHRRHLAPKMLRNCWEIHGYLWQIIRDAKKTNNRTKQNPRNTKKCSNEHRRHLASKMQRKYNDIYGYPWQILGNVSKTHNNTKKIQKNATKQKWEIHGNSTMSIDGIWPQQNTRKRTRNIWMAFANAQKCWGIQQQHQENTTNIPRNIWKCSNEHRRHLALTKCKEMSRNVWLPFANAWKCWEHQQECQENAETIVKKMPRKNGIARRSIAGIWPLQNAKKMPNSIWIPLTYA